MEKIKLTHLYLFVFSLLAFMTQRVHSDVQKSYQLFDAYQTRMTLVQSNPGPGYNWLFLPGGPGADSQYYNELIEILHLPGNVWFIDLPENGSNTFKDRYREDFDFNTWEICFKHVLQSLDNIILVGHSFSGIYPLLFPEIEKDLTGLVILCSASRIWIDNALKMAQQKNLPSFEKELAEFLSNKSAESFEKARRVFVHYYFTPETLEKGSKILFRGAFNFHAMNWWLSKARSIDFDAILIPSIPTLIVGGSEDCAVPFEGYRTDERFHKSNILLREIEGASHTPWLEKPEEVRKLFDAFIALKLSPCPP
jgi:pimeloyl-ACP methyl ester carboxylesterase